MDHRLKGFNNHYLTSEYCKQHSEGNRTTSNIQNSCPREIEKLLTVGLQPEILSRYPDQIFGGQAQRIAILRGMLMNPMVMILDEPTSALDVSVQAQILHLLKGIQNENGMSYVFISHDTKVVEFMSDQVVKI